MKPKYRGVFSKKPCIELLQFIFREHFLKEDNFYLINNNYFKVFVANNKLEILFDNLKEYYLPSTYIKYIESKKNNFKLADFITIIRQICKELNIEIKYEQRYDNSKYDYHYFVYFTM